MADVKKAAWKRILVFSTSAISDLGIDLAGSSHLHYPTSVQVISLPCSSGIKPAWIVHALEQGYDGVFIAACGGDCAYLTDCTSRTSALLGKAQQMLREREHQSQTAEDGRNLLRVRR